MKKNINTNNKANEVFRKKSNKSIICNSDTFCTLNFKQRGFDVVEDKYRKNPTAIIQLPVRGTASSAGYDFYSPVSVVIAPHEQVTIWTDICSYMQNGEVLILDVRSSTGINKGLMLANTIGVIDKDYYHNIKNNGNIGVCLRNNTNEPVLIEADERIAQGIFIPFLIADDDNATGVRLGGVGSTGK